MNLTRRRFVNSLSLSAAVLTLEGAGAIAAPAVTPLGRDAGQLGVKHNSPDDQTIPLQRAIYATAAARTPLVLRPGIYRTGELDLPSGAQIIGARGATRIEFTGGTALVAAKGADGIVLTGLTLDGGGAEASQRHGLISLQACRDIHIADCDILGSRRNAIRLETCSGDIRNTTIRQTGATAIVSVDAIGLLIAQNVIQDAAENGIEILRSASGDDGTIVTDNRIENIKAGPGGSGQYGNGINAFRAGNVIVRGNRIRNCDFSGVRGNSASNIQIVGNTITDAREVAIYSEFAFEGAIIANNVVDDSSTGISVANFNEGGRLTVVQGNLIRNTKLRGASNEAGGVGIYIEADASVTGNMIENAPGCGIVAGWGQYLRDVNITGNVIRNAFVGIGVSAVNGTGKTLVTSNLISNAPRGAIVGYDHAKPVTGDLAVVGASEFPKIVLGLNTVQ